MLIVEPWATLIRRLFKYNGIFATRAVQLLFISALEFPEYANASLKFGTRLDSDTMLLNVPIESSVRFMNPPSWLKRAGAIEPYPSG